MEIRRSSRYEPVWTGEITRLVERRVACWKHDVRWRKILHRHRLTLFDRKKHLSEKRAELDFIICIDRGGKALVDAV